MTARRGPQGDTEAVLLDIGEGVGALILYTRPELRGMEIEVSPIDLDSPRTHTEILERCINGQLVFAGVFPKLPAGRYRIWTDNPTLPAAVRIESGQVAEIDWR
jgi:hypothetical protein